MLSTSMVAKARYQHFNGKEITKPKLSLSNILFTILIAAINPMKHNLEIFMSVENPFMNEFY